jgi:hypothetical protein
MATGLNKQAIDALVAQARAVASKQIELADARLAAQSKKLEVENGLDPNSEKREALRIATQLAASRRTLKDVLDQYEHISSLLSSVAVPMFAGQSMASGDCCWLL